MAFLNTRFCTLFSVCLLAVSAYAVSIPSEYQVYDLHKRVGPSSLSVSNAPLPSVNRRAFGDFLYKAPSTGAKKSAEADTIKSVKEEAAQGPQPREADDVLDLPTPEDQEESVSLHRESGVVVRQFDTMNGTAVVAVKNLPQPRDDTELNMGLPLGKNLNYHNDKKQRGLLDSQSADGTTQPAMRVHADMVPVGLGSREPQVPPVFGNKDLSFEMLYRQSVLIP
ncbi:hypothetical protein B0H34DRAFT_708011 [Crassisporium funariophilum]|nr:hypothetical protein B0H34DRAFT_708011 [Crassisporium funariophilum]